MGSREPFWQPSQDLHSRDLGLKGDTQSGHGTSSSSGFWLGDGRGEEQLPSVTPRARIVSWNHD